MGLKKSIADGLEKLSRDIAVNSVCAFLWGEPEMPECLRKEVEEKNFDEKEVF
ncbi:MAG: cyclic lactone autoinducer peptide [Lachnospiraceae bacterium]|nr:cyclic lactone autoinducer peptide [Lachnospiraceae bacterium]